MPIIMGYRSQRDKDELTRFYASSGWGRARAVVLAHAGGRCGFRGDPPSGGLLEPAEIEDAA